MYFGRQQQTFSLRRGELNQQGAVVTYTHIHTQFYTECMEANCYCGRCDTVFIIRFNYNEKLSSSFFLYFGPKYVCSFAVSHLITNGIL